MAGFWYNGSMSEYPKNFEIENRQLIEFICSRIDISERQKAQLSSLLSEEPSFRQRLTKAYGIFNKPGANEEDKRSADLLLENIRSDVNAILDF